MSAPYCRINANSYISKQFVPKPIRLTFLVARQIAFVCDVSTYYYSFDEKGIKMVLRAKFGAPTREFFNSTL